jgi:TatD DNase family protein
MGFIKYIDVHTHVNLDAFKEDFHEVASHTHDEGVAYINVGTGKDTSARAVELLGDGVYATVGLHPVRAGGQTDDDGTPPETFDPSYYEGLARDPKVVAIGECGFDYYRVDKETKAKQEEAFIAQIELANDLKKPLMLHIRDVKGSMSAYEDALEVLKAHAKVLGDVHFFAGTYDIAKQFWDMGYTTSFTGVITFAKEYDETVRNAPLDMLHAETDAPYVAPVPFRGTRNEPLHVREVYKRIAELRGEDEEVVRVQLLENAKRLFSISL